MGLARITAPEAILNSELKSNALAEVTKNLRDAGNCGTLQLPKALR